MSITVDQFNLLSEKFNAILEKLDPLNNQLKNAQFELAYKKLKKCKNLFCKRGLNEVCYLGSCLTLMFSNKNSSDGSSSPVKSITSGI